MIFSVRDLRRAVATVFLALFFCAAPGIAQQNGTAAQEVSGQQTALPNADLFKRVESGLESGVLSPRTLLELRAQLVEVRDRSAVVVQRGSIRADALSAQLDSLGPPPGGDGTEAEEVAQRRKELVNELADANAPVRRAREVVRLAEVLIRKVDNQLRGREIRKILERYPSPLLPSTWVEGVSNIADFGKRLDRDYKSEFARPSVSKQLGETVPLALILAALGILFLLVMQRPIERRLIAIAERQPSGPRALFLAVVCNLSFFVLPAIGAAALIAIIPLIDVQPNSAKTVLENAPVIAFFLIVSNWMGHTLFSPRQTGWRLLNLSESEALYGLHLCQGLGFFLSLEIFFEALDRDNGFAPATISIVSSPIICLAAVLLWLLANLLRSDETGAEAAAAPEEDPEAAAVEPQDSGFLFLLSLLMKASAVLAVCVALAGYVELARTATLPMILTVGLLGFGFLLFHLALLIIKTVLHKEDGEEGLVLTSFALVTILTLILLPVVAMLWGARATDILGVWRLLTNGVQLGDIRLSLNSFLILVVIFAVGVGVTRWLQGVLKTSVLPQTKIDTGAQTAIVTGLGYVGMTLAALVAISTAGLNLSSLAVVAGALSVGIGFGLQTIVSNFVSGIILLVERPIKEGDWIEVSGQSGYVRKISVRSTRIETFDRHDVIIPNSDLIAGIVKNMTLTSRSGRLILPVGVAYGSDLEKVKTILMSAARGHNGILRYPAPFVLFRGLGDSSLNFELRCYLRSVEDIMSVQSDLYFNVYNELGKAGVEIPFPQRDLHIRDIDRLVSALERRPAQDAPRPVPPAAPAAPSGD